MSSIFDDVAAFHTQVLKLDEPIITPLASNFVLERARFLAEELTEFTEAGLMGNMTEAVDGLLDIIYVAAGTLWFMGVPAQECWNAVQKANMDKQRGVTSRGNKIDAIKPEGWIAPNFEIARILTAAFDRQDNAGHSSSSE